MVGLLVYKTFVSVQKVIYPNKEAESPGLNCRHNPQVCTGGSFCFNGYCVCPEGYEERDGECIVPKIYGKSLKKDFKNNFN
ncbi:unnamed protein product [Meloidogyne enterolobii]|uniref:Uncharacterized protein n=1 Tax=Meloidogyne enterolobii TaxID=390850 RepID=A0ACB1B278_MELEN